VFDYNTLLTQIDPQKPTSGSRQALLVAATLSCYSRSRRLNRRRRGRRRKRS